MNYIQTMKKGIKIMKKILLFPFSVFFYLLCGSAIGFSDIDQITIQKIFQDAFHAYASEFDVYKPEEFSEGFVSKLNEWGDRQSIVDIKKNKNSIINFSLRNLYTDGAYVDRIMGELLALEYVYKTTQRKRIGLPVYTMEESETARKMLEEFKLKYTNMLENKIDRFLDGMGKSEDPNMKELKNEVIGRVRLEIEAMKQSLIDPTYILAPTQISEENCEKVYLVCEKICSDILSAMSLEDLKAKHGVDKQFYFLTDQGPLEVRERILEAGTVMGLHCGDFYSRDYFDRNRVSAEEDMRKVKKLIEEQRKMKSSHEIQIFGSTRLKKFDHNSLLKKAVEQSYSNY